MNAFLTGTDTGVGKTFVTALLTRSLRRAGLATIAVKPLCCGDREDVEKLRAASGNELSLDATNPVWLRTPAAPLAAARIENLTISLEALASWFSSLSASHPSILVEGIGGWLVPLTQCETLADLAMRLALPVIPVVANRLGCINHTLLTLESIRARRLPCPGIILNHPTPPEDPATRTHRDILATFTNILLEIHPGQKEIPPRALDVFFLLQKN
jgi:dethiobiotin synthetase